MTDSGKTSGRSKRHRNDRLELRLVGAEKQTFKEAADRAGVALSAWVRERLMQAAQNELEGGGKPTAALGGPTEKPDDPKWRPPETSATAEEAGHKPGIVLAPEVIAFCTREGLAKELETAFILARTHFPLVAGPVVQLEQDPELDRYYLVLEITTRGTTAEVVAAHTRFAREWSALVPWPKSQKIRLVYDIE